MGSKTAHQPTCRENLVLAALKQSFPMGPATTQAMTDLAHTVLVVYEGVQLSCDERATSLKEVRVAIQLKK